MANKYNIGDIVGNNKIIQKDIPQTQLKHRTFWICECMNCGNIRSIRSDNLNRNKTCQICHNQQQKQIQDNLTGRTFGFLTVTGKSEKPNYWICYCNNCGSIKSVFRGNLTQGKSLSCGCVKSWGEKQISYWLQYYNIKYEREYTFPDLKTEKGGSPRFDFAILDNLNNIICLIEYDGRQHKSYDKNWNMSFEDYMYLQYTDKLKDQYCQDHNIKLFRFDKNTNIQQAICNIIVDSTGGNK